jgi:uncharacterized protein (DUF302 family)
MTTPSYGLSTRVTFSYERAVERVREELPKEGFGVLTEIDVRATMKTKLDVDFRPYIILGACNPPLAHRALSAELEIGLLLPCNVIVYEADDGAVVVSAFDPLAMTTMARNREALETIAGEVREKLSRVIDRVGGGTS